MKESWKTFKNFWAIVFWLPTFKWLGRNARYQWVRQRRRMRRSRYLRFMTRVKIPRLVKDYQRQARRRRRRTSTRR